MLARLEVLGGIAKAETDFTGEFLRLSLTDVAGLTGAMALLSSLGYDAEMTTDADVGAWYDTSSVGQLSRIEAEVIAARVLGTLHASTEINAEVTERLRLALVDALHGCFIATTLDARPSPALRASCVAAARDRAAPIVGAVVADRLAALVDADMSEDHKQRT